MLRTVIPVSAASSSIVRSFFGSGTAAKLPLCDGSLFDVTAFDVTLVGVMSPTLLPRRGLRFLEAVATPHGVDSYLEQLDPLLVKGECRAEVVGVEHTAEESVTLTLRPNRAWQGFRAGQFVNVAVEIDGVRHQRCYSPACIEDCRRDDSPP